MGQFGVTAVKCAVVVMSETNKSVSALSDKNTSVGLRRTRLGNISDIRCTVLYIYLSKLPVSIVDPSHTSKRLTLFSNSKEGIDKSSTSDYQFNKPLVM